MKLNMGKLDRSLRVVLGLFILAVGMIYQSWWGLIGLVPLGTAFIGWCPLYAPFKFSTRREKA